MKRCSENLTVSVAFCFFPPRGIIMATRLARNCRIVLRRSPDQISPHAMLPTAVASASARGAFLIGPAASPDPVGRTACCGDDINGWPSFDQCPAASTARWAHW